MILTQNVVFDVHCMNILQIHVIEGIFVLFVDQTTICWNVQLKRKKVTPNVGTVKDSMLVAPTNVKFFNMLKKFKIILNLEKCLWRTQKAI